jgi:hypothetical protein
MHRKTNKHKSQTDQEIVLKERRGLIPFFCLVFSVNSDVAMLKNKKSLICI